MSTNKQEPKPVSRPYLEHNRKYIDLTNRLIENANISDFTKIEFANYLPFSRQFFVGLMGGREHFTEEHYKIISKAIIKMRADRLREGR